jgi:hypothetical protein
MKKYLIIIIIFFLFTNKVKAGLEITEIMYAPSLGADYEWVEIYNDSSQTINLDKYRFFHGQNSGPFSLKKGESYILGPYSYALITKSLKDYTWLNVPNLVLSSSVLSLPDRGDNTYIVISDPDKNILAEIKYDPLKGGSKASKTSLSFIDGIWTAGIPTPGRDNQQAKIIQDTPVKNSVEKQITTINDSDNKNLQTSQNAEIKTIKQEFINLNEVNLGEKQFSINIPRYVYTFIILPFVIIIAILLFIFVRKKYERRGRPKKIKIKIEN